MSTAEKLTTIAENQQKVFKAGRTKEWSDHWDGLQLNGTRTSYPGMFRGYNDEMFRPKYDIVPTGATGMFNSTRVTDIEQSFLKAGVKLDMSKCTGYGEAFAYNENKTLPELSTVSASSLSTTFREARALTTIRKLILKDDGSQTFNQTFDNARSLANIVIEGVIGRNINFQSCPLSVDSMKSIINALKNYAGTDSANVYTLSFNDDCWIRLEADSTAPSGSTWKEYVDSLGWNT